MDLDSIRAQIPTTQRVTYFNTGWSGPSPRPVIEAITERLEFESSEGPTARHVFESRRQITTEARQAVAHLLNVTPEEIALTQNTTQGLNIVLSGLPWNQGDEVVTCNLEHSSALVPLYYLRQRHGIVVKIVEMEPGDSPTAMVEKLEAAMGRRTRLLALSHISYSAGACLPLAEIEAVAHRHGALVLWDGAQSVGHIAVDLRSTNCDFYALTGHKWLLGPDGVGALFIRGDLIPQVAPAQVAFWGAKSYDLKGNFEPNPDTILKFELTTSSGPLLAGFSAAIRFIREVGIADIEARIKALASQLRKRLAQIPGVSVPTADGADTATGLVGFAVDGLEAQAVVAHLWEAERIVARSLNWPASTRISVEFFNTEAEIDKLVAAVTVLAREGIPDYVSVERQTG